MKSRFVKLSFAIAALLFALAPAGATTSVSMDGSWWRDLPESSKVYVAQGLITGFEAGYNSGAAQTIDLDGPNSESNKLSKRALNHVPHFSKTFGTYVHEISDFYENNPEQEISLVGTIFRCFADDPFPKYVFCTQGKP